LFQLKATGGVLGAGACRRDGEAAGAPRRGNTKSPVRIHQSSNYFERKNR